MQYWRVQAGRFEVFRTFSSRVLADRGMTPISGRVVRLSDLTDETTSPERQLAKIETYAKLHDHELIGVAEDLDVSGAVPPDKRPQLGPWLKRLDEWDACVVARFDRLSRSVRDFANFCSWLDENGKALVCLDPQIDLSTPAGRSFAQMLSVFAEFERSMIAARVKDAYTAARKDGRYAGGQQAFGYRPVKRAKGWGFEPLLTTRRSCRRWSQGSWPTSR